jgi:hypothetical protein
VALDEPVLASRTFSIGEKSQTDVQTSEGFSDIYCQVSARGMLPGSRLASRLVTGKFVMAISCWVNVPNANDIIVTKAPI